VSAEAPPFLTTSKAAARILSFVMLTGLAIIKQLLRYCTLQKYGKQLYVQLKSL